MNKPRSLLNSLASGEKPLYLHVVIGGFFALLVFLAFWLLRLIVNESAASSLLLFDFLFVFLLFPLKGRLWHKLALLTMGNMVGLTSSFLLSFSGVSEEENSRNILFVLAYPIVNMIWIVVMWAIGLSVLASKRRGIQ